ncbi:MAG TPA: MFS transporter [Verrucomicrobiae bacterium]|nr:MFS transporter [Verrucomicrobiae bacterium]
MNSFGTVYYAYYLFFFMRQSFGFSNKQNLMLSATYGAVYTVASFFGGRIAQRIGFSRALKIGFSVMALSLLAGWHAHTAAGQVLVMCGVVVGMCFTWPTLEALVSDGETPVSLPQKIGIYNLVWAGTGAVSFFVGGTVLQKLGFRSIFYIPALIQIAQLILLIALERRAAAAASIPAEDALAASFATPPDLNPRPIAKARAFQRMAWLANPFAYIAINTLLAFLPGIAARFRLSAMLAGFICSIWCFARLGTFFLLWAWTGWHYRFRWLLLAFVLLIAGFIAVLTAPSLLVLVFMQVAFGAALGLIYYSSLFYSMQTSETKGEHGGIHEAAIGLGNFAGPAIGAASIHYLPGYANSGAIGVGVMLLGGLFGLVAIQSRSR